jgi:ubiquinone biosynthesis protein
MPVLARVLVPTPLAVPGRGARPRIAAAPPLRFRALRILVGLSALLVSMWCAKLVGRYRPARAGRSLRRLFERLGGLWIKAGQLLSLRVDLFHADFCGELAHLQDRVRGFTADEARRSVEASLGRPLEEVFSSFDPLPFAAASIGQVHLATLRVEGVEVAVKVRRPEIAATSARELRLLRRVVRGLDRLGVARNLRFSRMVVELEQVMLEELDYRYEAANLRRMRKTLRAHGIHVPRVFLAHSDAGVLVMERVVGLLMSEWIHAQRAAPEALRRWEAENGVDPRRVGRKLIGSLLRQVFEDNLYHGDLHPGNVVLLRDSQVALIDLGTVGVTDVDFLDKYRLFMRSLGALDFAKAADILIVLGRSIPTTHVADLREDLVTELRSFSARTFVTNLPYHQRSISTVAATLIAILARYRCSPDWSFLRIRRAEQTLDASIAHLVPDLNYTKLVRRYFRAAERRRARAMLAPETGATMAVRAALAGQELLGRRVEEATFAATLQRRAAFGVEATTGALTWLVETVIRAASWLVAALLLVVAGLLAGRELASTTTWLAWVAPLDAIAPRSTAWLVVLLCAGGWLFLLLRRLRRRLASPPVSPER